MPLGAAALGCLTWSLIAGEHRPPFPEAERHAAERVRGYRPLRPASAVELAASGARAELNNAPAAKGDIYRVRRVFHFRNDVKMFDIAPPLDAALRLTPATFTAALR